MQKLILHEEVQHDFSAYESDGHSDRQIELDRQAEAHFKEQAQEAMRNPYGVSL